VVVAALREHRAGQAKERLAAGSCWTDSGLVFTSRVGTPLEPDNLRRSWYEVRKVLDEPLRLHDLRHTCVTLLLEAGVAPHIVQEIAGHSALEVTMTATPTHPWTRSAQLCACSATGWRERARGSDVRLGCTVRGLALTQIEPGEKLQVRVGGQGRGRTADLPIFSRTLVPTELPGRTNGSCRS
jgi:Phage integrase family